jgi:hypothetical protein
LGVGKVGVWRGTVCLLILLAARALMAQGPPFQTDDPVPVDFQNYEFYVFGGLSSAPTEVDTLGPAFEFNWGAVPRVQLHAILPLGAVVPVGTASGNPRAFGWADTELGVKVAFFKETKRLPQIGMFPMFELPTGGYATGLGVGKAWYKAPLWVQKNEGKWLVDGGGGFVVNTQVGYRSFPYGGGMVKRELGKKLELAAEVFAHAEEGDGNPYTKRATLIDAGGYWHIKEDALQLLFAYGHSVAGEAENYAYLGLYTTWGKKKDEDKKDADAKGNAMLAERMMAAKF